MLKKSIWLEAGGTPGGFLHLACVVKRLGRKLRPEDFTNAGVNYFILNLDRSFMEAV
jgi:hypothetical protein